MQETRGGAARATTQTSEREVVRDAARVNVCAKAAYLSTIGALFSRWGDDYEAAYEAARLGPMDGSTAEGSRLSLVRPGICSSVTAPSTCGPFIALSNLRCRWSFAPCPTM